MSKAERWVNHPTHDALVDSWHIYPPVTAYELLRSRYPVRSRWASACRIDHRGPFGPITRFAQRRPLRYRPWKIAR